jgi:hypothetical protein
VWTLMWMIHCATCELLNYKLIQHQQVHCSIYCVLLIYFHMFWHNCHLQGAYTNVDKTCSDKIVVQLSCISDVQFSVKIYGI